MGLVEVRTGSRRTRRERATAGRRAVHLGVALVVAVAGGLLAGPGAWAASAQKVVICHATASRTNPYVQIEVALSAVNGERKNDHSSHPGDIIPAVLGLPGQNWDAAGQAILAAGCRLSTVGDADRDGLVDGIDPDDDNDNVPDAVDADDDGDGIPDAVDADDDNDGTPDQRDPDQLVSTGRPPVDHDRDGIADIIDADDDGDGMPDASDRDADGDGAPETSEQHLPPVLPTRLGSPTDDDGDGSPAQPSRPATPADDQPPSAAAMAREVVDAGSGVRVADLVVDRRSGGEMAEYVLAQERSLVTDAGVPLTVTASCRAIRKRSAPADAVEPSTGQAATSRSCRIVRRDGNVLLRVPAGSPVEVDVHLAAPAIGDRLPVDAAITYRLR